MKLSKEYISIFQQLIETIEKGLYLLDESSLKEIRSFISSQQHSSGAFIDRGKNPDIYYSLFGFILISALKMQENLNALQVYITKKNVEDEQSLINKLALVLISEGFIPEKKKKLKLFSLLRKQDRQSSIIYRIFLFSLVFDSRYGKNILLYFIARLGLSFYKAHDSSPASIVSALIVARQMVGLKTKNQVKKLLSFFNKKGGFRSFNHVDSSDMLSTGVCLFALQKTGFDFREIAPVCFDFIQLNFDEGAFLSGDGDQTCDLEYTFYGLLALGSLSKD